MGLVTVEAQGGAAVISYANPPFGTMTAAGSAEMYEAITAASADPAVRAIVLTGGLPDIFVRHYDVGELSGLSEMLSDAPPAAPAVAPSSPRPPGFSEMIDAIDAATKPVIAAINGLCMGGGFEMSLACDLRIAGTAVTAIGLPETRIGIFPGGGGTQRLPRMIGEARAVEFVLRGRVVDAPEALQIGLVHELAADPLARALELAAEFASRPAEGLAYARRLTRAALDRPLAEGLADERRSFVALLREPSARAALKDAARPNVEIQKT
jgi:enoyl-CoA hydratase/carnithine racemase